MEKPNKVKLDHNQITISEEILRIPPNHSTDVTQKAKWLNEIEMVKPQTWLQQDSTFVIQQFRRKSLGYEDTIDPFNLDE